ncbi:hypothetical protein SBDP2_400016 [Syntrophobacter sp. SbD2]|nr:hypothetical protein SBDP2_400016 [Syntrophobacter sp. SbD2]
MEHGRIGLANQIPKLPEQQAQFRVVQAGKTKTFVQPQRLFDLYSQLAAGLIHMYVLIQRDV